MSIIQLTNKNFHRIVFYESDTQVGGRTKSAGTLTIFKTTGDKEGDELYSQTLIDKPIWLHVKDWEITINHHVDTTTGLIKEPAYKAILPFGKQNELCDLRFGVLRSEGILGIQELSDDENNLFQPKIGTQGQFHATFIGTDDLRNGRTTTTTFNMEREAANHLTHIYLKLVEKTDENNEKYYDLEVGQMR